MSDFQSIRFREFSPPAVQSIKREAVARGLTFAGDKGDDAHTFGAHLSKARLEGTGHKGDYTLTPPPGATYERAVAGIDIGLNTPWAGEWLDDLRHRCETGAIGFLGEIIGDPDLILGPGHDIQEALYASPRTKWKWVEYTGEGHIKWCHLWVLRNRLADAAIGARVFDGWDSEGREMNKAEVEAIVRAMDFKIRNHTYTKLDAILNALSGLADRTAGEGRKALVREVRDAVLAELRATGADE